MEKKNIFIILAVLAACGIGYILYRRRKTPLTEAAMTNVPAAVDKAGLLAIDPKDKAAYDKLISIFSKYDRNALAWLMPDVEAFKDGTRDMGEENKIRGKRTLSGAFMASFGASYWPDRQNEAATIALTKELYSVWNDFKIKAYTS